MLSGKNILLAVTGGIAAYKMADVASMLVKQHADVHIVMTEHATKFITAETFQILTKNKVFVDVFDEATADKMNRNMIYTAITRSIEMLHVFTLEDSTAAPINDLKSILKEVQK
jgi:phosphopantothenoylcysteine synthetase/decarboxylase